MRKIPSVTDAGVTEYAQQITSDNSIILGKQLTGKALCAKSRLSNAKTGEGMEKKAVVAYIPSIWLKILSIVGFFLFFFKEEVHAIADTNRRQKFSQYNEIRICNFLFHCIMKISVSCWYLFAFYLYFSWKSIDCQENSYQCFSEFSGTKPIQRCSTDGAIPTAHVLHLVVPGQSQRPSK